jgi:hypothetical protein
MRKLVFVPMVICLLLSLSLPCTVRASSNTYKIACDLIHGKNESFALSVSDIAQSSFGCEIHNITGDAINASDLEGIGILVLPNPHTPYYSTQEINLLLNFVNNGGGFYITITAFDSLVTQYNGLFGNFGFTVNGTDQYIGVAQNVTGTHQIMSGVQQILLAGNGYVANLTSLVHPAEAICYAEGFPLFLVSGLGSGRIFVDLTNYGINSYDTSDNQRVVKNALIWLSSGVIPEFPSFLILPLFLTATLLAVITYKRKEKLSKATCVS